MTACNPSLTAPTRGWRRRALIRGVGLAFVDPKRWSHGSIKLKAEAMPLSDGEVELEPDEPPAWQEELDDAALVRGDEDADEDIDGSEPDDPDLFEPAEERDEAWQTEAAGCTIARTRSGNAWSLLALAGFCALWRRATWRAR